MKIVIKAKHLLHKRDYRGAVLTLPAGKGDILDALDKARIPYGSGEYQLIPHKESPGFISKMLNTHELNPSIAEINHLTELMAELYEDELHKLEGIVQIRSIRDIADIINATHNLHRFTCYNGVTKDESLGELAIDAADVLYKPLQSVPDELLDCLERAKVGALI